MNGQLQEEQDLKKRNPQDGGRLDGIGSSLIWMDKPDTAILYEAHPPLA
jgi:hypothetical protein